MTSKLSLLAVGACFCAGSSAVLGLGMLRAPARPSALAAAPAPIAGDYVEVRTASVFCGPCHYNGELMTTGRDALMAWKFDGGTYQGVSLAGVCALADVSSSDNLSLDAPHTAQLVVDSSATDAQVAAVTDLIREKCGSQLGQIAQVTRAPISFVHTDAGYVVSATGVATMNVSYRTDDACCVQPQNVWYEPLSPVQHRKVGFTESVAFTGSLTPPWSRTGEDSAFYGAIAF